ncbi:hypothetical protein NW064_05050 [Mycoplasmopsis felis]|uniref:PTS fructose transporter subunit IIB n=1 Tax=Mycoplasmopsis felis TaxID=33923 RepID=UPI0021AEBFF1|nr:hypothetical protein [Mycoplasmopsis felis]UWW00572.1 hypothetical protein NW064_05050 [Mycoplasmopsis felis]
MSYRYSSHIYGKDKLYQEAQDIGISIKVETQGAEGIENKLTEQEIKNAKGVILAVDREIEKSRFANAENVLEISTQKAIHNPGEQIRKVLNKEGTKLQVSSSSEKTNEDSQMSFNGFGKKMYRSLMSDFPYATIYYFWWYINSTWIYHWYDNRCIKRSRPK